MSSDPVIVQMDVVQAELDELREIYTREHPPTEPEPATEVIRIRPGDDAEAAFRAVPRRKRVARRGARASTK